ncbi:GP88 family protein [Actinomadura atramentaria]|uniref:GP88 family protein n=1 Tax=Actinomadura atramentaria TaxID=1990 RepID=UPI000686044E
MPAAQNAELHARTPARPTRLLTRSNRRLAREGTWTWTLPALAARLPDGRTVTTCPSAGVCAQACYARAGAYRFPAVRAAHIRNLAFVLDDPAGWETAMRNELRHPRFIGAYVRIHDSGDFFSDDYLAAWLRIVNAIPGTHFYCYTKEVLMFRRHVEPEPPANLRWIYSLGGRHDQHIDLGLDRTADVFPTENAITDAGWNWDHDSDLRAAYGPTPIGMAARNIPQAKRRQGNRTFGEWQHEARQRRSA